MSNLTFQKAQLKPISLCCLLPPCLCPAHSALLGSTNPPGTTWALGSSSLCTQGCSGAGISAQPFPSPKESSSPPLLHTQTQLGLCLCVPGLSCPQHSFTPRAESPRGTRKQQFQQPLSRQYCNSFQIIIHIRENKSEPENS